MSEKKNKWEKIAEEVDRQEMAEEMADTEEKADKSQAKKAATTADETASVKNSADIDAASAGSDTAVEAADIGTDAELNAEFMDEFSADMLANAETITLRKEIDAAKQQMLEMRASMANQEARSEREMKKARQFANEGMIKKLLPVIDSLTMGLGVASGKDNPEAESLLKGMNLTNDMLLKVLQEFGVSIIDPATGDAFDPDRHEAMTVQNDANQADNTVLQTLQRGYALQDRVLRAAMVVVNRLA